MRKALPLLLVGFILIIATISNPPQERHQEVLEKRLKEFFAEKMEIKEAEEEDGLGRVVLGLGKIFGNALIDLAIENKVTADNYLFFSLTKVPHEGEEKIIGIGIFGNVFITQELEKALEEGWFEE